MPLYLGKTPMNGVISPQLGSQAIDSEVNTQAQKIAELSSILDGKAAGGGSSGVETCEVTIIMDNPGPFIYINDSSEYVIYGDGTEQITISVLKPSFIIFPTGVPETESGNCEFVSTGVDTYFVYGDAIISRLVREV